MIRWIVSLFKKKKHPRCGGEYRCDVVDKWGRACASIWYRMPNADEMIEYVHDMQYIISDKEEIEKIALVKNKSKEFHLNILMPKSLPYAKKIFLRSSGFRDDKNKPIELGTVEEQFEQVAKYHSHKLLQLVQIAYNEEFALKKN